MMTDNVQKACDGADILVTDTYTSMGQEAEGDKRRKDFAGFQINRQTLSYANSEAMVLHCLPAYRGQEITEDILESYAEMIFDEAENRLHAQKAVLLKLMEGR
jgi:ornithine carbamoyltransferase